jgi:hypothetical protein
VILGLIYRLFPKTRPTLDVAGHVMFYLVGLPMLIFVVVGSSLIAPGVGLVFSAIFVLGILLTRALYAPQRAREALIKEFNQAMSDYEKSGMVEDSDRMLAIARRLDGKTK